MNKIMYMLFAVVIAGCSGADGKDGVNGADGSPGAQGPQGEQGIQGIQGDRGATGPQGLTGDAGPQGLTGTQGEPGVQGEAGPSGSGTAPGAATTEVYDVLGASTYPDGGIVSVCGKTVDTNSSCECYENISSEMAPLVAAEIKSWYGLFPVDSCNYDPSATPLVKVDGVCQTFKLPNDEVMPIPGCQPVGSVQYVHLNGAPSQSGTLELISSSPRLIVYLCC